MDFKYRHKMSEHTNMKNQTAVMKTLCRAPEWNCKPCMCSLAISNMMALSVPRQTVL